MSELELPTKEEIREIYDNILRETSFWRLFSILDYKFAESLIRYIIIEWKRMEELKNDSKRAN